MTHLIERLCEEFGPTTMRNIPVTSVIPKEVRLRVELVTHRLVAVDVLLASVDDADESQLERIDSTCQNIERVRASVRQIQLCQNSNGSTSLWIDIPGQL